MDCQTVHKFEKYKACYNGTQNQTNTHVAHTCTQKCPCTDAQSLKHSITNQHSLMQQNCKQPMTLLALTQLCWKIWEQHKRGSVHCFFYRVAGHRMLVLKPCFHPGGAAAPRPPSIATVELNPPTFSSHVTFLLLLFCTEQVNTASVTVWIELLILHNALYISISLRESREASLRIR